MSRAPANPRPTAAQLARYAELFNESPPLKMFGARVSFPALDRVQVDVDSISAGHRGGLGSEAINGGVLAAIFDLVIGCTGALVDPTRRTATAQLSMSFMRPVAGNALRATAHIDRAGDALLFASGSIFDAQNVECASCQGVVRLSQTPWASGESPAL